MKRRNFIKSMFAGAAAVVLPACKFPAGPTESIGFDAAKPNADESFFAIFDEEHVLVEMADGSIEWDDEAMKNGLVEAIESSHQEVFVGQAKFMERRDYIKDEMNIIASVKPSPIHQAVKRLDANAMANFNGNGGYMLTSDQSDMLKKAVINAFTI